RTGASYLTGRAGAFERSSAYESGSKLPHSKRSRGIRLHPEVLAFRIGGSLVAPPDRMDLQARRQGEKMEQQKGRSPEASSPSHASFCRTGGTRGCALRALFQS